MGLPLAGTHRPVGKLRIRRRFHKNQCILRADRVVRPYGVRVHRNLTVGADDSVGPLGSCEFAEDFRKNSPSCRGDVGIAPYNRCVQICFAYP